MHPVSPVTDPPARKPYPARRPARIDAQTASTARVTDFLLGGVDHYACDREAAARLRKLVPGIVGLLRTHQSFRKRLVQALVTRYGVRQFIDLGCGLPSATSVHHLAQRADRSARIVYVDRDPHVLGHAWTSLEENDLVAVVDADITVGLDALFDNPSVTALIAPHQPTAVLCLDLLHAIPGDDGPADVLRRVARHVPGGFIALSHLVTPDRKLGRQITELMADVTGGQWGRVRTIDEVNLLMDGLALEEPGLVDVASWHTDFRAPAGSDLGGVAMVGALACVPAAGSTR